MDLSLEKFHQIETGDDDASDAMFPVVSVHNTELDVRMLYLFRPVTFVVTIATEDNPEELMAVRKQVRLLVVFKRPITISDLLLFALLLLASSRS